MMDTVPQNKKCLLSNSLLMSSMWKSLNGMQWRSPPNTKKQSPITAPVWPSLAAGRFPYVFVSDSS